MMQIPFLNILCMAISALISIGAPIVLFIVVHKKYKGKFIPALVGAAAFVLFALVLEQLLHGIVLRPDASGVAPLMRQPFLYVLYGAMAAGVFEETSRFLSFHILKKRYSGIGNALAYGVGHGGIESILIAGVAMVSNIIVSILLNSGSAMVLTMQGVPSMSPEVVAAQLGGANPVMFLLSGFERLMTMAVHIALSVIVYYSVVRRDKWWLYPAAILLHAVVDVPAALMQVGVLRNVFIVEALLLAAAVALVFLALATHRRLKPPSIPQEAQL